MNQIIQKAATDLREAKADLATAEESSRAAKVREQNAYERVHAMQAVWDWLQVNGQPEEDLRDPAGNHPATSVDQAASDDPPETRFGKPVPEVANTDLCFQALESLGKTASTKEIRARLARDGRDLSLDQIRGSLKYLSRKTPPLVETASGSGVWRVLDVSD